MNRLIQWVMAVALICSSTVFTSCSKDDNPVNPADNLAEKIIGKWIVADLKGEPALTNEKMVTTFISSTKAIVSSSKGDYSKADDKWNVYREDDVKINGNIVTLTGHPNEKTTLINEYTVSSITDKEIVGKWKHITIVNDKETVNTVYDIRLTKVSRDYRETIIGIWEGQMTSEEDAYSDGKVHRWEYKADGTYAYYSLDEAGEWVPSDNTLDEYFVDGSLLCMRWIDNDVENREWWEIVSIKNDVMKWKGLRQKEDGSTYTATFEMKKVE